MTGDDTPLTGPPPVEVPLTDPPLIRVIAQVRFPLIASIEKRDFVAPFQEAIRQQYPVLRPEQSQSFVLGIEGAMNSRVITAWRFHDVTDAWRVTLAPDFLALETTSYTSRDDFLGRFNLVLTALKASIDPQIIDRLGVRYVDRVSGSNLDDLPKLLRPEVCGILATSLQGQVRHSISESVFVLPNDQAQLVARWGLLPAHTTFDPAAVDPIAQSSWILDIDAFQSFTSARPLEVDPIVAQTRRFAERIYSVFRWAVTDEFLRRYGGDS